MQRSRAQLLAASVLLAWTAGSFAASKPVPKLTAVSFTDVEIDDAFWTPRIRTNRRETIPHILDMCEVEGRVRNMWRAAGQLDGPFQGTRHHDADLFKAIEAASYSLRTHPDAKLAARLQRIVDAVVAAQREDGYLHSYRSVVRPGRKPRTDLQLFAAGHLIDAAVAYHEATGDRRLVEVARRFADLIHSSIGPGGRPDVPSHPKIEASLVRLYRLTGTAQYLELARHFVDERGRADVSGRRSYGLHSLDHCPVRQQDFAEGHAICALFLYEGLYDVGVETGDGDLVAASKRLLHDAVTRKMYVTGAMGRVSDERFTEPFALDNRTSIGEGCQSAALARLAHRLLLLEADANYADVMERVWYNNLPAALGLDGRSFFYVNRLSVRPEDATGRPYVHPLTETVKERLPRFCLTRQPWFKVPCCPPNVAMTIATLGGYVYARSDEAIYVNLYVGGRASLEVAGTTVRLAQKTQYPWDGSVRIAVDPAQPRLFDVYLRVPDWCRGFESTGGLYRADRPIGPDQVTVRVNHQPYPVGELRKGYLRLRRDWAAGDVIELGLPMPVMRITCDPRVTAGAGRVALARGPIVYCAEGMDHGGRLDGLWLPAGNKLRAEHRPGLLGGVTVLTGTAVRAVDRSGRDGPVPFLAVPYAVWANREPGQMDVWLPQHLPGRQ